MTPERRAIRRSREVIQADIDRLEKELSEAWNSMDALRSETCRHPAMKIGSKCGMSYSDCPDCHWSHP